MTDTNLCNGGNCSLQTSALEVRESWAKTFYKLLQTTSCVQLLLNLTAT